MVLLPGGLISEPVMDGVGVQNHPSNYKLINCLRLFYASS